jgi:protein SCO1/2
MKSIKRKVPTDAAKKVQYVLISLDPTRDTPEVLRRFADKRKLPADWVLLTAKDEKPVRELSHVLGVNYKKVGQEFAHSNLITVLDGDGVIKFSKPNIGQQIEETASAIAKAAIALKK